MKIVALIWIIWCIGFWAAVSRHRCTFDVKLAFWAENDDGDMLCQDAWYQCECGAFMRSIDERTHNKAKFYIKQNGGYIIPRKEAA